MHGEYSVTNHFQFPRYYECGPLLLDSNLTLATLGGEPLSLTEEEYNALYLLATRRGSALTFEKLYTSVWEPEEGPDRRDEARSGLTCLMEQVNAAGSGLAYIETLPGDNFTLRLTGDEADLGESAAVPTVNRSALPDTPQGQAHKGRGARLGLVTGVSLMVCAAAAVFFFLSPIRGGSASGETDNGFILLEDDLVPLGLLSVSEAPAIDYPAVGDLSMPAGARDLDLALFNPNTNSCYFIFEISLADTGKILYISELMAPAAGVDGISLISPLEKGDYQAELSIRAYSLEDFSEIDSAVAAFTLTVD